MNNDNRNEFAETMTALASIYKEDLTSVQLEIYWRAMKPFPYEDFSTGLTAHVTDPERGRFFPLPADIIHKMQTEARSAAERAFAEVEEAVRRTGTMTRIDWVDGRIPHVLTTIGSPWSSGGVGSWRTRDLPRHRRTFVAAYLRSVKPPGDDSRLEQPPRNSRVTEAIRQVLGAKPDKTEQQ